jgi:hypothetical protein
VWYTPAAVQGEPGAELALGDIVRLKKPHPCGSDAWRVMRLGADIGLRCQGCQHRVLMPRSVLRKRLKSIIAHGQDGTEPPPDP